MQKLPKLLPGPEASVALSLIHRRVDETGHKRYRDGGLTPILSAILVEVQREMASNLEAGGLYTPESEIEHFIKRAAERYGIELSSFERDELLEHVEKDKKPFGILQSLVEDAAISDIIITNYSKVGVQQARRNLNTELSFPNQDAYEAFVERLLLRAGSTYSTKKPIADGMIGSYARIHAVHRSICESGPYLTIRLNRFSTVNTADLVKSGLAPQPVFDYLQGIIRGGQTMLIVGEVGTGKTTLVRALAGTIPPDESILVIEDTPEIKLEHPHVRYVTTREANGDGAGRISPSECIRGGMRMAMNRIIFGEIRDAEAAEAFIDVCASGHPGLSTIHARSALEAITRLELFLGRAQKGVQRAVVNEQIVTAVQVIVFVNICKVTGRRRIVEVQEIGPVADSVIRHREIFRYGVRGEIPYWSVPTKVSAHRDLLESGANPVVLSALPQSVELGTKSQFQEAFQTTGRVKGW